jgi:hypothetical protein
VLLVLLVRVKSSKFLYLTHSDDHLPANTPALQRVVIMFAGDTVAEGLTRVLAQGDLSTNGNSEEDFEI